MNRRIQFFLAAFATASIIAGAYVGIGTAQPTISLPIGTVTAVAGSSVQIVGANPSRRALQICIPNVAQTIAFLPAPLTPTVTSGISMVGSTTGQGAQCFTTPNITSSGTSGGVGAAWNAIASGAINVTVLEY
jgi:hypothetical protein